MVVKKFRPAVPERRLVLVALQNELLPAAEPITLLEVFRHTPNEKIWPLPRNMENPGQHCGRSRFSMCSADDDGVSFREKYFLQNFRHRTIRNLAVQHFFQFWIAPRNYIAHNHQIRCRL